MQKLLLALILLVAAPLASAADSPKDVQALIAQGNYPAAEAALREAVSEHPQSAKAHYVLAEVLAHEGNIGEAKAEADKASALDPATHFTDPAKFQSFRQKLNQALAPAPVSRSAATSLRSVDAPDASGREHERGGFGFGTLVVIVVVVGVIAFIWSRRRRAQNDAFPGYGSVPPPPPGAPYGGPGGYPGYAPPPPSGMGSTIAAGVGGLAAGVLLDEALRSHTQNDNNRDSTFFNGGGGSDTQRDPSGDAYNDLRNDPIDMGNNDSSWDDSSSSSDDSGSFDDNSW